MCVEIREIITRNDLKEFIRLPLDLYRGSPWYVPSLNSSEMSTLCRDKNPAFEYCLARYWMVYKNGVPAGRVAAILNRMHIQRWDQNYLRFGWLDFIDDHEASAALFEQVENWALEMELDAVHGPLGFALTDREGMLVEGFDRPATAATTYNYPYYPEHMERLGYTKDNDWVEYQMEVPEKPIQEFTEIAQTVQTKYKLHLHEFCNRDELLYYVDQLNDLMNNIYQPQYGVVPLTPKQLEIYINRFYKTLDLEFAPAIMDENGRLAAFALTMPSLTKILQKMDGKDVPFGFIRMWKAMNRNDRADILQIMVRPEYRDKGVYYMLMDRILQIFRKRGIRYVESNPELESNDSRLAERWECLHFQQFKRRRVYIKNLIDE